MARGSQSQTLEELRVQHKAARGRREEAPLGSEAYREAAEEIARIEVEISRLTALPQIEPVAHEATTRS